MGGDKSQTIHIFWRLHFNFQGFSGLGRVYKHGSDSAGAEAVGAQGGREGAGPEALPREANAAIGRLSTDPSRDEDDRRRP